MFGSGQAPEEGAARKMPICGTQDPTADLSEKGFFRPYVVNLTTGHMLRPGAKAVTDDSPVLAGFAKARSDLERVRFAHGLPFVHTLQLDRYTKGKSLKEAVEAKARGNALFGKGKDFEAVLEYTRGILVAPWPTLPSGIGNGCEELPEVGGKTNGKSQANGTAEEKTSANPKKDKQSNASPAAPAPAGNKATGGKEDEESILSLTLANRSAALYRLGLYQECLEDVSEALGMGYPAHLRYKLIERAGSCHLEEGDLAKAEAQLRLALETLRQQSCPAPADANPAGMHGDNSGSQKAATGSENKPNDQWTKNVEQKLARIELEKKAVAKVTKEKGSGRNKQKNGNHETTNNGVQRPDDELFCDDALRPEFSRKSGINPRFTAFSGSVGVRYQEDSGRYTVADKNIKAGETLAIEQPIVTCIMAEKRGVYCTNCLKRFLSPYPCPGCSVVAFCSKACRQVATTTYHKYECEIQQLLDASGMSITCAIALRLVTQIGLTRLREFEKEWEALGKTLVNDRSKEGTGDREMAGMNKDGLYLSASYNSIYSMVDHLDRRRPADLFHKTLMSIFLMKSLQLTNFFGEASRKEGKELVVGNGGRIPVAGEDELFVAAVILRNLQIVQFNVHEISEFRMKSKNEFKGANSVSVGAGIYPTVCLMNHSCNPGIVRYFLGSKMVVKSLNNLRPGDLVSENYGPVFTRIPFAERQYTLKSRYWFDCSCIACAENWPMYTEMCNNDQLRLMCKGCRSRIFENQVTEEVSPVIKCKTCGLSVNVLKNLKKLETSEKEFKNALGLVEAGETEDAMRAFFTLLDDLDGILQPPYKDFQLCQEFIRRCMLTMGSHWYPGKLRF